MRRLLWWSGLVLAGCSTVEPLTTEGVTGSTSFGDPPSSSGPSSTLGEATTEEVTTGTPKDTMEVSGTGGSSGDGGTQGLQCGAEVVPGPTTVVTTNGGIEGAQLPGGVVAFLGVPYAEAPLGELRLRPPVERACQPGVALAQTLGPVCPQIEKDAQGTIVAVHGEEDCLSLNVWTPGADAAKRPVLVFIHGGGNSTGSGTDELFDGAALAAGKDVVVVTLNYRLGALGFLVHPALAGESPDGVSGNYGILDQIAALEWVKANIAGMGGDPGLVTVFGESAGAVNTCSLVGSPRAAGLFQRAIVQSGSCSERTLTQLTDDIAAAWIASAGCEAAPDVPGCLRALDAAALVKLAPDGYPNVGALGQGWGPHVDGVVLPVRTLEALAAGTHNAVPLIVGANAGETANSVPPMDVPTYEALVKASFGPLAAMVLAKYPAADYGSDGDAAWVALTSDLKFICGARRSARAADAGQAAAVFRYHFAYDAYTALPNTPKAAFHGLELVYIFGNWDAVLDGMVEYAPNPDDLAMSATLQSAWTRFAATGDPAGMGLQWPQYVGADDNAALLDAPPGSVQGVRTAQCDFWDSLIP